MGKRRGEGREKDGEGTGEEWGKEERGKDKREAEDTSLLE